MQRIDASSKVPLVLLDALVQAAMYAAQAATQEPLQPGRGRGVVTRLLAAIARQGVTGLQRPRTVMGTPNGHPFSRLLFELNRGSLSAKAQCFATEIMLELWLAAVADTAAAGAELPNVQRMLVAAARDGVVQEAGIESASD